MADEINIEGNTYVSSKRASQLTGYAQDYIGQLARGGYIEARRIGGLWHVSLASVQEHEKNAELAKSRQQIVPQNRANVTDIDSLVSFDGRDYISASHTADLTGYHQDYVGQLARSGIVAARQVGNRWYVDRESILAHKSEKDGLLGAVQSASTGIDLSRTRTSANFREQPETGSPAEFTYSADTRDLQPEIAERVDQGSRPHRIIEIHPISAPSVALRSDHSRSDPDFRSRSHKNARRPHEKAIFYGAVAVLSVLSVALAVGLSYRHLWVPESREAITSVAVGASLSKIPGGNTLQKIGDFLEPLLSEELRYKRN